MQDIPSVSLLTNSQDGLFTVSPSQISTYRDCPKLHYYTYGLSLKKKVQPTKHFDKGNYTHELFHVYYRYLQAGVEPGSDVAIRLMGERILQDMNSSMQIEGVEGIEGRIQFFKTIGSIVKEFVEKQSPKIDKGMKVVGVEREIRVPFILPSGRTILLHGFLDLLYEMNNQLWIRDHKTDSSGQSRKFWEWGGVECSPQFLHYALALWLELARICKVEVNYILTKDYVNKIPSLDQMFGLFPAHVNEKILTNYMETTGQLIDEMLDSQGLPHYDEKQCKYCLFNIPCLGERRGIPSDRILASHYVQIDRSKHREPKTTNQNSDGSNSGAIGLD